MPAKTNKKPAKIASDKDVDADAARSSIDEQMHALKVARNNLAPISKLSTELLSSIFKLAICADKVDSSVTPSKPDSNQNLTWREFNNIAHVCKSWRSVAFSCPSIWTRLTFLDDMDSECVLEEMLSGSTAFPRVFKIPGTLRSWESLPDSLLSRVIDLESARELHLELQEQDLSKILKLIFGDPPGRAINLRAMFIKNTTLSPNPSTPSLGIPTSFFSISMPRLLHLEISNCKVPWSSMTLYGIPRQLTSLKLCHVTQPPRTVFYDLLSFNSNLETLHLESALPPTDSHSDALKIRRIKLKRLSSCTIISSSLAQCVDFQEHVSYPIHTTRLHFAPSEEEQEVDTAEGDDIASESDHAYEINEQLLEDLFSSCAIHLDDPLRCGHQDVLLENLWKNEITKITIWDSEYPDDHAPVDDPALVMDLAGIHHPPLLDMLQSLPRLRRLTVDVGEAPHRTSLDRWFDFFKRHAMMKHLFIRAGSALPILSALQLSTSTDAKRIAEDSEEEEEEEEEEEKDCSDDEDEDEDDDDERRSGSPAPTEFHPCLPRLESLTLEGHGNGLMKGNFASFETGGYEAQFSQLMNYLIKRHEYGSDIQKLTLMKCHWIDEDIVGMLETVVGEVDWDGVRLPLGDRKRWF